MMSGVLLILSLLRLLLLVHPLLLLLLLLLLLEVAVCRVSVAAMAVLAAATAPDCRSGWKYESYQMSYLCCSMAWASRTMRGRVGGTAGDGTVTVSGAGLVSDVGAVIGSAR